MTWNNLSGIQTSKDWVYSEPLTADSIRVRHSLSVAIENLPWRFYGLIAQAFGYPDKIELFDIRRLYPSVEHNIFVLPNYFPSRERRIAIRGQRKYRTNINWFTFIDTWQELSSETAKLANIEETLNELPDALLSSVASLTTVSSPTGNPDFIIEQF